MITRRARTHAIRRRALHRPNTETHNQPYPARALRLAPHPPSPPACAAPHASLAPTRHPGPPPCVRRPRRGAQTAPTLAPPSRRGARCRRASPAVTARALSLAATTRAPSPMATARARSPAATARALSPRSDRRAPCPRGHRLAGNTPHVHGYMQLSRERRAATPIRPLGPLAPPPRQHRRRRAPPRAARMRRARRIRTALRPPCWQTVCRVLQPHGRHVTALHRAAAHRRAAPESPQSSAPHLYAYKRHGGSKA